jgi:nucleoside-diphosphate-sugar epimerase
VIVAVVGASGNIGSALLDRLQAAGHEVVGIARRPPSSGADGPEGVRWVDLDLTGPAAQDQLGLAFADVDVVVHLAWGFQPTRDTAYLQHLDVGGTAAVLRASTAAGVSHLVHVSSVGAYSPREGTTPVDESWPTGGAARLPYSRHKAAAERLLDAHETTPGHRPVVARIRPSLVGQRQAGGALGRYTLPSLTPAALVRHLPVLPLDRGFWMQLTHADDIADGIARVIERRATGPFNLSAEPSLRRDDVAVALGARPVHLPWSVLRALAALAWWLRLQPVDPGWLDMAAHVPRMSSDRARTELGWLPEHHPRDVLAETVNGIAGNQGTRSPALRPRRWSEQLVNLVRHGPVTRRPMA